MAEDPEAEVREEIVVWEYLRWDGKYEKWCWQPILKAPDFDNEEENKLRWAMLAGNDGFPGDLGQVARIRYPFDPLLPAYRWTKQVVSFGVSENAFLNYHPGDGKLLRLDDIVKEFLKTKRLPPPFNDDNTSVVNENLLRLQNKLNLDDFNAILFCRPTPGLPEDSYRIVEGTKRVIAYRVAQFEGIELSPVRGYFGDYSSC